MKFKEPKQGVTLEFKLVPRHLLKVGEFQRDISPTLVNRLVGSVHYAFFIPLLVVEDGEGKYEVVDGQHRLASLDKTMAHEFSVPCIIAPSWLKDLPIIMNIEKVDNVKDKATKLYKLYMKKVEVAPEMEERELERAAQFQPYLFTIAFSFMESDLKSPSLVETVVKLLDKNTFQIPLSEAVEERRARGKKVKELEDVVQNVASAVGVSDFNLKRAIVSRSKERLWGRKRNINEDFWEGMETLIATIMTTDWSWLGRV